MHCDHRVACSIFVTNSTFRLTATLPEYSFSGKIWGAKPKVTHVRDDTDFQSELVMSPLEKAGRIWLI
jgi:hypothetical protein